MDLAFVLDSQLENMKVFNLVTNLVAGVSIVSGASLTQVSNYGGSATSKAQMQVISNPAYPNTNFSLPSRWVYVPDTVKSDALVVVIHSCQSSAQSYFQNSKIPWKSGSDKGGYVTVWPSSPNSGTCWDVSSKASLTHGGGGDSNAIANMITYSVDKYKINSTRVFVTGGSSGGEYTSLAF